MTWKPIKTEFTWTGDGFGASCARQFKQLKREGDIALYERTVKSSGRQDGYEVIRVTRHNGYTIGKGKKACFVEPAETYPGASQFGKSAWSLPSNGLAMAEALFAEKVKESKTREAAEAAAVASGVVIKRRGRPRKVKV